MPDSSFDSRVELYFPTIMKLWSFAMLLKDRKIEIDTQRNLLIAVCSADERRRATSFYEGIVIKKGIEIQHPSGALPTDGKPVKGDKGNDA